MASQKKVIISDHNPRVLSKFWDEFFAHLGTDLRFSTAFHTQTDGQSEVTNGVMENFCGHTWSEHLTLGAIATSCRIRGQQFNISQHWVYYILFEFRHPPNFAYAFNDGSVAQEMNKVVQSHSNG